MKRQLSSSIAVLALLLAVASAYGQSKIQRADVPFDFVVTGKTLPAGKYQVRTEDRFISVQSLDSGRTTLVPIAHIADLKSATSPKLVFHKYRGTYFLREVWPSSFDGYDLPVTKREREVTGDAVRITQARTR